MKRVLSYIAIAAVATACSEMYGPEQESTAVVNSDGIEITDVSVTDNSITFTLAPNGEASYYSYLVDQADAPETLDAQTLYEVGYSSVSQGTVKWTSEKTSSTVTLSDLAPNTTYQIYAVAGSPTGVPGEVVVASAKTTDGVNPAPGTFASEGAVVTVTFSENVTPGDGAVTASYYAVNSEEFNTEAKAAGTLTVPVEDIAVDGASVSITVNGLPAGALYTVSLAEGAFRDSAGNPTPAVNSGFTIGENGSPEAVNINGEVATEAFSISPIEDEIFTDPSVPFTTVPAPEYEMAGYGSGNGTVTFSNSVKTTEIAISAGVDFGMMPDGTVAVYLPELPERGDNVTITIEEDAFEDIYGNPNAEWTATLKYSYGYTTADIAGEYEALGQSAIDGGVYYLSADEYSHVTIAEDDSMEGCNVSISGVYLEDSRIYGYFDVDAGTLSVPDLQYLCDVMIQGQSAPSGLYFANYSEEAPVVMSVPAPGQIVSSQIWMYYLPELNGYLDVFAATQMTRMDPAASAASPVLQSQSASVVKAQVKGTATKK